MYVSVCGLAKLMPKPKFMVTKSPVSAVALQMKTKREKSFYLSDMFWSSCIKEVVVLCQKGSPILYIYDDKKTRTSEDINTLRHLKIVARI